MHFVDEITIQVKAGDGGDGCASFRREKYVPRGGPDGGNGGKGGDVIIATDLNLSTLLDLASHSTFHATDGRPGMSKKRFGANGQDLVVRVPPGTIIIDEEKNLQLKDLKEAGQQVVVARGGAGGRGNAEFASPAHRTPREWEPGKPGQERRLRLVLKLIADFGLIGCPNAGKSTLLSHISAAHPKVAAYPFTTLQPELGIVETDDYQRFTVADLPGLIEGAHDGKGLGDEFLRHVERTRVLVHVVDAASVDGPDPLEAYDTIREELRLFSARLAEKPEIVAANKMDLSDAGEGLERMRTAIDKPVVPISAVTGRGLRDLIGLMVRTLSELVDEAAEEPPAL